jgi:Transglutaminase-like superfamily
MKRLPLESWLLLLHVEFILRFRELDALHRFVRERQVKVSPDHRTPEYVCRSVDLACVFYFKRVLCLQRSAVTTVLLRRYGWKAEMVIGAQILPFKSHAWVEIEGKIVNENPYMCEMYSVLERC